MTIIWIDWQEIIVFLQVDADSVGLKSVFNRFFTVAMSDTPYRWRGILPQKSSHSDVVNYSNKVFLGGLPLDANEQMLADTFSQFGPIT